MRAGQYGRAGQGSASGSWDRRLCAKSLAAARSKRMLCKQKELKFRFGTKQAKKLKNPDRNKSAVLETKEESD